MLETLMVVLVAAGGCTKDTDCKGDRVCEDGRCVNPPLPAAALPPPAGPDAGVAEVAPLPPPPPPAPNPGDYPKVVRKPGMTCVQSLGSDGVVREDCRRAHTPYSGTATADGESNATAPPPPRGSTAVERSSVMADFAAMSSGGVIAASNSLALVVGFGLHLSVQGRLSDSVALGGMLDGQLFFPVGGNVVLATLAPALRFGEGPHLTLGLGPSILYLGSQAVSGAGLLSTLVLHGAVPLVNGFGIHPHVSLSFGGGGIFFCFGLGLGGSSY